MLSGFDSPWHWLVILVIAALVFGPKRLPEIGRSLGSGLRGLRESFSGEPENPDGKLAADEAPAPTEKPGGPKATG